LAGPVIAVWSPKGGVGKTVISAGLAMNLERRYTNGAMLIDLDAGKSDVAPLLKVSLHPNLLEYTDGLGRTVTHPTGLEILPGVPRLVDEGLVTGELALAVLQRARNSSGAVVIDLDSDLRDSTIVTMEQADAVIVVTTPDLLSIYAARRFTQEAQMIGMNLSKFRVVINRVTTRQEIPEPEILSLIGLGMAGRIPDLPGLALAINRGMISTVLRSTTEFAVSIHMIADKLAFVGVPASRNSGLDRMAASSLSRERLRPAAGQSGMLAALIRWWNGL